MLNLISNLFVNVFTFVLIRFGRRLAHIQGSKTLLYPLLFSSFFILINIFLLIVCTQLLRSKIILFFYEFLFRLLHHLLLILLFNYFCAVIFVDVDIIKSECFFIAPQRWQTAFCFLLLSSNLIGLESSCLLYFTLLLFFQHNFIFFVTLFF